MTHTEKTSDGLFAAWPTLAALPDEARAALEGIAERVTFEPSDTVFTMGQADGSVLYFVAAGTARLTRAAGHRGDISVQDVVGGDVVGLRSFARQDDALSGAALQAVEALELIEVDAHALRDACRDDGTLALALLAVMAGGDRQATQRRDPQARVFRHLLSLVRQTEGGRLIPEMPRHAALAEAAGVSDVEAASAVADLIAQGIARRNYPGLEVLDSARLHEVAYS